MNVRSLKRAIAPYFKNLQGWRTNRKIVVIESDDWGSIRMPSKEVYKKCLQAGCPVDQNPYERYDSLASEDDLELLFELLTSFRDRMGNHPVITANALVANPDFEKIKESGFLEYHYEMITETFKKYPEHARCFELWMEGMKEGVFYPQSHGREHLNVSKFMRALQDGEKDVLFGFDHEIPGSIPHGSLKRGNKYVEALFFLDQNDKEEKLKIILEGLKLFEMLFGYRSESLIPLNYLWSRDYDGPVSGEGIRFYQGNRKMKEPQFDGVIKYHSYRLGEENSYGQRYLVRNAQFEPSLFKLNISDPVGFCLNQVTAAFRLKKPAVICTHRINYVGYLDSNNRDRNLNKLMQLLTEIGKRWPEAEFMNSVQLGNMIADDLK